MNRFLPEDERVVDEKNLLNTKTRVRLLTCPPRDAVLYVTVCGCG